MMGALLRDTPLFLRGSLKGSRGDVERYLVAAVAADPEFAEARIDLAKHYRDTGKTAEARRQAEAVVQGSTPQIRRRAWREKYRPAAEGSLEELTAPDRQARWSLVVLTSERLQDFHQMCALPGRELETEVGCAGDLAGIMRERHPGVGPTEIMAQNPRRLGGRGEPGRQAQGRLLLSTSNRGTVTRGISRASRQHGRRGSPHPQPQSR